MLVQQQTLGSSPSPQASSSTITIDTTHHHQALSVNYCCYCLPGERRRKGRKLTVASLGEVRGNEEAFVGVADKGE